MSAITGGGLPFPASPPNPTQRRNHRNAAANVCSALDAAVGCFLIRMSVALALVHVDTGEELSGSRQRLDDF